MRTDPKGGARNRTWHQTAIYFFEYEAGLRVLQKIIAIKKGIIKIPWKNKRPFDRTKLPRHTTGTTSFAVTPKISFDLQLAFEWRSRFAATKIWKRTCVHSCAPRTKYGHICAEVDQLACGALSKRFPPVKDVLSPCWSVSGLNRTASAGSIYKQ